MKILFVHSGNAVGGDSSKYTFVRDQGNTIAALGNQIEYYAVMGHGLFGYLRNVSTMRKLIKEFQPDVIHAHYGLCGLLANMQRKVPVVTTYHGSDINSKKVLPLSKISISLSAWNIFVSKRILNKVHPRIHYSVLPCGITMPKNERELTCMAEIKAKLTEGKNHILFAGAFDNKVKNASLAKATIDLLSNAELIELKGYTREQVWTLMYNCDSFLMTSYTEGSPQTIKETMACGCPIVSVDVGDVAERIKGLDGCYVAKTREPEELAALLQKAIAHGRTKGREKILKDGLDNEQVAMNLMEIYKKVVKL